VIIQVPRGGVLARQLEAQPPPSVAGGDVILEHGLTDEQGVLEPPSGGQVVLSVPSPEALEREAHEVRRVISGAGPGVEPLVVVVDAAEELREEELAVIVQAAEHSPRPVILRVIRNG
jgi:hypothetical protein